MTSISSHVLDTALGRPAAGLPVRLDVLDDLGSWTTLAEALTDGDGRVRRFVPDGALHAGMYRVSFDTKAYLEGTGQPVFYPRVEVCFVVEGAEQHYHVPLLLSPFGYSTYRGS
jgi:5-hydroxyisourate hydrolase